MSYPQRLSTGCKRLWDTPNAMRNVVKHLTCAIRFLREKRTATAVSSLKRRKRYGASIAILAVTSTGLIHNANAANYSIDHLKLYAHSRILDYKEFQCFNRIITKESRWSYVARNGSHWFSLDFSGQKYPPQFFLPACTLASDCCFHNL